MGIGKEVVEEEIGKTTGEKHDPKKQRTDS